jgi:hypothetical protein
MFFEFTAQETHSKFLVTNQSTKVFGKTLQTLVRDRKRSVDLRKSDDDYEYNESLHYIIFFMFVLPMKQIKLL